MESVSCAPSAIPNLSCGYFSDSLVTLIQYARPGDGQDEACTLDPSLARFRMEDSWYITMTAMICPLVETPIDFATPMVVRTASPPADFLGTAAPLCPTEQLAAAAAAVGDADD